MELYHGDILYAESSYAPILEKLNVAAIMRTEYDYEYPFIDNNVGVVRNNCEQISELSKKLQEAYSDLAESREQLQRLQRADERLRQNINNLKK